MKDPAKQYDTKVLANDEIGDVKLFLFHHRSTDHLDRDEKPFHLQVMNDSEHISKHFNRSTRAFRQYREWRRFFNTLDIDES